MLCQRSGNFGELASKILKGPKAVFHPFTPAPHSSLSHVNFPVSVKLKVLQTVYYWRRGPYHTCFKPTKDSHISKDLWYYRDHTVLIPLESKSYWTPPSCFNIILWLIFQWRLLWEKVVHIMSYCLLSIIMKYLRMILFWLKCKCMFSLVRIRAVQFVVDKLWNNTSFRVQNFVSYFSYLKALLMASWHQTKR